MSERLIHCGTVLSVQARSFQIRRLPFILAILLVAMLSPVSQAHETDQFTVPTQPLADIGPEVTAEIARRLQSVMDELNAEMDKNPPQGSNDSRQDPDTLARRLMASFGQNPFQTEFEGWIYKHDFKAQPALFQVKYNDSVFSGCAVVRPLMAVALSPTVNINGVYLGLDKVGHFVQQGFAYYERYQRTLDKPDALRTEALEAAIRIGISQENGIYGSFTIGVYSNADMAANYAGLYFYLNLTQPVSLGGRIYPPVVELHEGRWRYVDGQYPQDMFTRFITHHLNEAMNPPVLTRDIRSIYEKNVRRLATNWVNFYVSSAQEEEHRMYTLTRWFGEPYGYAGPENVISIASVWPSIAQSDSPAADETQGATASTPSEPSASAPKEKAASDAESSAALTSMK